ncbi:YfhO family protein [Streptomyces sp. SID8381]|uniref:YfhO family protein n=1 Tax=unclassified Streptomyces TaxID=2593676 RepID=UPI0005667D85|nr:MULTISPECIES: YfhO family protein [unclassified Streptomyces]MYX31663.1 YfhO family protein [Streptomyces sp. SID8381]
MQRPTLRGRPRQAAALLAAVLTVTAFCAADAVAGSYPFGPRTRAVNDLGNQYVPFHAHLWDLLHGRADGGLLVNWQSGYGSSFLPDLGTYLSSPFALLVALFPRDEIDLAVYAVTVLKTACAGAAMAWLLLRLRPGRWWAAGLLGAAYALCGWSVADASYNPMWLDGLVALPLLCLVGEWVLAGRRRLLGVVVVALAWIANFYTAYMATLGAALVLLLRIWLLGLPRRRALTTAGRAAATVVLGVGLSAPLVTVIYLGTKHAYPGRVTHFAPVGAEDLLARLLPTTYGFGSPALFVGTTALLLALALPFHRAAPRRVRAGWPLLVAAVTLSMQWTPTHLAWHAFATPNGSPYRQAFVLCALLVIAAWHSLSYGVPDRRALGAAAALLALVAAVASGSGLVRSYAWPVLLAGAVCALGGLLLLARTETGSAAAEAGSAPDPAPDAISGPRTTPDPISGPRATSDPGGRSESGSGTAPSRPMAPGRRAPARPRTLLAALAVVLLIGAQLGEATATSAVATRLRLNHLDDYAPWGARQQRQADLIAEADGWPRYRTDPGREQTVGNDPMVVGGQGAQYYSSLTADVLSRTLTALGDGWTSRGRNLQSLDNAVTDAVFSVGARVHSPPDQHQRWNPRDRSPATVTREDVPPLVTVRPAAEAARGLRGVAGFGPSPYRNQELLLGARVYTVPALTVRTAAGEPPRPGHDDRPGRVIDARRTADAGRRPTITAQCPAGSEVYLWAPHYSGTARLTAAPTAGSPGAPYGPTGRFTADAAKIAAMQRLGAVPDSGRLRIELTPSRAGTVPDRAVGCLDTARLRTAVQRLEATGATEVTVSDGTVRAKLPAGSTGTAVLAAPRIAGWRCAAGDAAAEPARQYYGLIAVPLDGSATSVTCTFHPPGLRLGAAAGGVSLLALAVLGAVAAVRRRRTAGRRALPTTTTPRERTTAAL